MSIPSAPWVFQVAWEDPNPSGLWEHPYTNYLGCIKQATVRRQVIHAAMQPETMQITCLDPDGIVKPLKESSPLWPNVKRNTQCRLLARKPDLSFVCVFMGFITNITPDSSNFVQPQVTFDVESALTTLAQRRVTVPPIGNPYIYEAEVDDFSALTQLLLAAGYYQSPYFVLESVGHVLYGTGWGGGVVNFGDALADLAYHAGAVVYTEYLVPATDADPAWRIHWAQPTAATTPAITWDWRAGELEAKPTLKYTIEART